MISMIIRPVNRVLGSIWVSFDAFDRVASFIVLVASGALLEHGRSAFSQIKKIVAFLSPPLTVSRRRHHFLALQDPVNH
jgi:hypothetical protein